MKSLGVNPLIHEARKVNDEITNFYLEKLSARVPLHGQNVVIYGLAYREGVKESAFSGAFTLKKLLEEQGSKVYLMDELYEATEILSLGFTSLPEDLKQFSLVIHTADSNLDDFIAKYKDQILFVIEGRENRSSASKILKERYIGI
jgi:UDP-N-acetyl-D-mannosaminuronate dehydrogenase